MSSGAERSEASSAARRPIKRRSRLAVTAATRAIALTVIAFLGVLPLLIMVIGSLRPRGLPPPDGVELIVADATLLNYDRVGDLVPLRTVAINSLVVVAIAVPVTVVVASLAGFAIATAARGTRRVLIGVTLVALAIPAPLLWVPRFAVFRRLNVVDSVPALAAPALMATTPLFVLLLAYVYSRFPRSLFESARMDGLSPLQTWRRVALPAGRAATFAVALLAFAFHWSNTIEPLLLIQSGANHTVALGLRTLSEIDVAERPAALAGAVIGTTPAVVAFLIAQRSLFTRSLDL